MARITDFEEKSLEQKSSDMQELIARNAHLAYEQGKLTERERIIKLLSEVEIIHTKRAEQLIRGEQ